jgi:hypothetical protein
MFVLLHRTHGRNSKPRPHDRDVPRRRQNLADAASVDKMTEDEGVH